MIVKTIYIPLDTATNNMGARFLVTLIVYVPEKCSRLLDKMIVSMSSFLITVAHIRLCKYYLVIRLVIHLVLCNLSDLIHT